MRRQFDILLRALLATALALSCATTQAVPKAAEHPDAPVSFGEAGAPPKPTATSKRSSAAAPASKAGAGKSAASGQAAPAGKTSGKTAKPAKKGARKK